MTEPEETVASVVAEHPVAVVLLFGSHGRREATAASDVDVVDLGTAPASPVRAVFRDGRRLVGSERAVRRLRTRLLSEDTRSLDDRFDDAIERIDDHLA